MDVHCTLGSSGQSNQFSVKKKHNKMNKKFIFLNKKLNQILLLTSISPLITETINHFNTDPLILNFIEQLKTNKKLLKVTDLNPEKVELKTYISKISRKQNKAIVEILLCDEESCSKILFTAKRPHYIWFYDDIVVDSTFSNSKLYKYYLFFLKS